MSLINNSSKPLCKSCLDLDALSEIDRITSFIQDSMAVSLKKRGLIIALSGGIDSSVTAALCVRAVGRERVLGLLLPERHSSHDTTRLGRLIAKEFGIKIVEQDITSILHYAGCYAFQDEVLMSISPKYKKGDSFKVARQGSSSGSYKYLSLIIQNSEGYEKHRLDFSDYLKIVAATNFKQRTRKMLEYYYADRYNYAVAGSPNRLEYDQGFFVKNGDGAADIKPIAHLYKTQVYQLAEYLNIPLEIQTRPPTTDTYPMEQSQEEFYFSLPYDMMDLCLFAINNNYSPEDICSITNLTLEQAQSAFKEILLKRKTTNYLHLHPLTIDPITLN